MSFCFLYISFLTGPGPVPTGKIVNVFFIYFYFECDMLYTTGPEVTTIFTIPISTPFIPTFNASETTLETTSVAQFTSNFTSLIPSTSDTAITSSGIKYFDLVSFHHHQYTFGQTY